ncbi:MAG: hypothetical protein ABIQ66_01905, partial [Novosphingobium sp.]
MALNDPSFLRIAENRKTGLIRGAACAAREWLATSALQACSDRHSWTSGARHALSPIGGQTRPIVQPNPYVSLDRCFDLEDREHWDEGIDEQA